MHSVPDSVLLRQREVKRVCHAQWHFQMQLSWGPRLIASMAHTGQKRKYIILSKQQITIYQSFPPPSKSSSPHTNSSNRYRFYAYFSHSSIANAYVKGLLIYVYQLCGALLLGNVIILMVFLLYSKVANEAYCKKVIDFH